MTDAISNETRAERAEVALRTYVGLKLETFEGSGDEATDLIADLLHYVASLEDDPDAVERTLRLARLHFDAEHGDPEEEGDSGEATPLAPYDNYEIHPCRRIEEPDTPGIHYFEQCEPAEADVWTLYGHCPEGGVEAIGDFISREAAVATFARIVGIPYGDWDAAKERIRVMQAAPALLEALEAGRSKCWVHNAGLTHDIEALRRIALERAVWWNLTAIPLIEEVTDRAA